MTMGYHTGKLLSAIFAGALLSLEADCAAAVTGLAAMGRLHFP